MNVEQIEGKGRVRNAYSMVIYFGTSYFVNHLLCRLFRMVPTEDNLAVHAFSENPQHPLEGEARANEHYISRVCTSECYQNHMVAAIGFPAVPLLIIRELVYYYTGCINNSRSKK